MKYKGFIIALLYLLFSTSVFAQDDQSENNEAPKTFFRHPISLSFLTNDSAKGFDITLGMLSYDRYFGETNSYVKKNATRVITLNYPLAYYLGPSHNFFFYPKVGLGYGWSVVEVKDYGTEKDGAFVFNLHPQVGFQLGKVGVSVGYLYHAFKFKFNRKGVLSVGLMIGLD